MRSGKEASEDNTVVLSRAMTQHGRKSAVENRCGFGSPRLTPEVPPRVEYALSELGKSLKPVLDAMKAWGENYRAEKS